MPQPYNYAIDPGYINPAQAVMQGMQVGGGLLDLREQALQRDQAAAMRPIQQQQAELGLRVGLNAEQQMLAQQQMQAATAQSAAVQAAKKAEAQRRLATSPMSQRDFAEFSVMYPEEAQRLKDVASAMSAEEKRQRVIDGTQVYSALRSGDNEAAKRFLERRAEAYEAAGEDAKGLRDTISMIDRNPIVAQNMMGAFLSVADDKFISNLEKEQTLGSTIQGAAAKASQEDAKAIQEDAKAKYAFEQAAAGLGLTKAQIAKIYADMQRDKEASALARDKAEGEKQGKPLEASAVKEIGSGAAALGAVASLRALRDKFNIGTGPLRAAGNSFAQIIGMDDPNVTQYRAEIATITNQIIKELSGAAVSESEMARIREGMPTYSDDDNAFNAKLKATEKSVARALREALKANRAAGRDVSKFAEAEADAIFASSED